MFTIYTKDSCDFCVKLKKFMQKNNLTYTEKILKKDFEKDYFDNKFNGTPLTYPKVINYDGKLIGGYSDFVKYFNTKLSFELI